jgi:hypothetical protein
MTAEGAEMKSISDALRASGLKWGMSSKQLSNLRLIGKHAMIPAETYKKEASRVIIGKTELTSQAECTFWKDQLIEVSLSLPNSLTVVSSLKDYLSSIMGDPISQKKVRLLREYRWEKGNDAVSLFFILEDKDGEKNLDWGLLTLWSSPLMNKTIAEGKAKDKTSGLICNYDKFDKECYQSTPLVHPRKGIVRVITHKIWGGSIYTDEKSIVDVDCLDHTFRYLYSALYIDEKLRNENLTPENAMLILSDSLIDRIATEHCPK